MAKFYYLLIILIIAINILLFYPKTGSIIKEYFSAFTAKLDMVAMVIALTVILFLFMILFARVTK